MTGRALLVGHLVVEGGNRLFGLPDCHDYHDNHDVILDMLGWNRDAAQIAIRDAVRRES